MQQDTCPFCQTHFDFKPTINLTSSLSDRDTLVELNRAQSLRERLLAADTDSAITQTSANESYRTYRTDKETTLSEYLFNN